MRIVNAARGELIDDEALLAALDSGRVAGAALDVHAQEPPMDWRLAKHPQVVAMPHLGASTREAQERVGTDIAQQVRDYLKGGVIQQAVNFFSLAGDLYDQVRPAMDLAERLGLLPGAGLPRLARAHRARPLRRPARDRRQADPGRGRHRRAAAAHGRGAHARERARRRPRAQDRGPGVDLLGRGQLREPDGAAAQDERRGPLGRRARSSAAATCASSTWTASRWTRSRRATCCWCATTTRRAWSARSARCSARTASTSRAWASAASPAAAARSC